MCFSRANLLLFAVAKSINIKIKIKIKIKYDGSKRAAHHTSTRTTREPHEKTENA
jgi:hypothetical protein